MAPQPKTKSQGGKRMTGCKPVDVRGADRAKGGAGTSGNLVGILLHKIRMHGALRRLSCPPPPSFILSTTPLPDTYSNCLRTSKGPPVGCFNCTHAQLTEARFAQDARNLQGVTTHLHSRVGRCKHLDLATLGLYLPAHMDLIPKAVTHSNTSRLYLVIDRTSYTTAVLKVSNIPSTEAQGYRHLHNAGVPAARLIWNGRKFSEKLSLLVLETLTCTLGSVLMAAAQEIRDAGNFKLLRDVLAALGALLHSLDRAGLVCADLGVSNIMCRELRGNSNSSGRYWGGGGWGESEDEAGQDTPIKLQLVLIDPHLVSPTSAPQLQGCHPAWARRWNALHLAASIQSLAARHCMDPRVLEAVLPALLQSSAGREEVCRDLEGMRAAHLPAAVAHLVRGACSGDTAPTSLSCP